MTEPESNDLAGLFDGSGTPDLGGLLEQAQKMMADAASASDAVVEGVSAAGLVRIRVDGRFDFKSVRIDPGAIDPDEPSWLEDLVLAALRDAAAKLNAAQQEVLGGIELGGLGLGGTGLGGIGLGGGDPGSLGPGES